MPLSQVSSCLSDPVITVLGVLLPHLAGTVAEKAELAGARLCIWARAQAEQASCPGCGRFSVRVHSRYQRRLADAAIGGRPVLIRLTVRRFFCPAPDCPVITFAEQVEGLTVRYARRTPPLAEMLTAVGLALAGARRKCGAEPVRWRGIFGAIWPVCLVRSPVLTTATWPGLNCVSYGDDRAGCQASGWPGAGGCDRIAT
jgi:hypothetical protein